MQLIKANKRNYDFMMHQSSKQHGFTLFEIVIVLIIMGIMMTLLMFVAQVGLASLRENRSKRVLDNAQQALQAIILNNDMKKSYPCPANPAIAINSPSYGYEDCTMASVAGARNATPISDEYIQRSGDVLVGYLPNYIQDKNGRWVSMVNFLPQTDLIQIGAKDPWGHRLIYAVSKDMSDAVSNGASQQGAGQIQIVDEYGRDTGGTKRDAFYVLISQGAYADAVCQANPDRAREFDNCDFTTSPDSKFRSALISKADNNNYFDDKVAFIVSNERALWSSTTTETTPDPTVPGNIGINLNMPSTKIDVNGRVRAERSIRAGVFCDASQANCYDPSEFMKMGCSSANGGPYMKGVTIDTTTRKLKPACSELEITTQPGASPAACESGRLRGVYTDGTLNCM